VNLTTLVDVAIGLSLVYLGASLFVTIVNEYVAQVFKLRARQLGTDLKRLIDGKEGIDAVVANPALAPFFQEGAIGGSYVDTRILAEQLVGGLRASAAGVATMADLVSAVSAMKDSNLKKQLLALTQVASASTDKFVGSVSVWIDRSLTMMGEVYKKKTQIYSFWIGLAIAAIFNLDTLGIANHLYRDKEAREAIAALGSDFVQKTSKETLERCGKLKLDELRKDSGCAGVNELLEGLQRRNETFGKLPIGWPPVAIGAFPVWTTLPLGWLLTALAISLGASFWFDLLNRLVNIRHGMRRPEPEKKTEKPAS
jgi:hypothetical protein